jgi:N-acetylneuraminic acid mutarotase
MKTSIFTLVITLYSISLNAQDVWVQKDSVNGPPRSSCASFVLNGEGFVVGGLDITEFKRKMYSYDVDQDDWDNEVSIGGINGSGLNRGGAIAFTALQNGYVGLGQGNTVPFFNDLWAYDPTTQAWTQKASFIGSPRRHAVCFEIDDIAYVGTGQDINGFTKDFYAYDASINMWTQVADFAGTPRKSAVGFTMGGQGYVGTGDDGILRNDFWQFIPENEEWVQKASFPGSARSGAVGFGIFPTAFIACGYDNAFNYKKDVWAYNYFTNTWSPRNDFPGLPRSHASAFVINKVAYLGLGYSNGQYLDDFWAYAPIVSLPEQIETEMSQVFPNPAYSIVNIKLSIGIPDDLNVEVYNLNGALINVTLKQTFKNDLLTMNINTLPKGIYILKFNSKSQNFSMVHKLIVQ